MKLRLAIQSLCVAVVVMGASVALAEPGWNGTVIARGELRREIKATPILERPNRPFHFYGNTVRREYYRGQAAPRPRDMVNGTRALFSR